MSAVGLGDSIFYIEEINVAYHFATHKVTQSQLLTKVIVNFLPESQQSCHSYGVTTSLAVQSQDHSQIEVD